MSKTDKMFYRGVFVGAVVSVIGSWFVRSGWWWWGLVIALLIITLSELYLAKVNREGIEP